MSYPSGCASDHMRLTFMGATRMANGLEHGPAECLDCGALFMATLGGPEATIVRITDEAAEAWLAALRDEDGPSDDQLAAWYDDVPSVGERLEESARVMRELKR